jgi:arylsulfatase A-like enzyme|tara:strand:- start:20533 stop:22317 length:1785 start_codon:yes stop_codon:yes gene_type:complete
MIYQPSAKQSVSSRVTILLLGFTLLSVGCNLASDNDVTVTDDSFAIADGSPIPEVRPNIIVILADDLGYSDIAPYGSEIETPNLNRLAQDGVRFSNFYNTARCSTTRASLLTGLYSHQTGLGSMPFLPVNTEEPSYRGDFNSSLTVAEFLRPAGYATYMVGKWHITPYLNNEKSNWPLQRGFDRFYGTITGAGSYFEPTTLTDGNQRVFAADDSDYYYTDVISQHATTFINDHALDSPTKPFFLYVAYTAPHWPLHAPEETIAKYKGHYDAGWDEIRERRISRLVDLGILDEDVVLPSRDSGVSAWDETIDKAWHARAMETYAAQVDHLDKGIGKILAALEVAEQLDNTLILFLSDNGAAAEIIEPSWAKWLLGDEGDDLAGIRTTRDGDDVAYGNDVSILPGDNGSYQSYGVGWANASNTPFKGYKKESYEGGTETPFIMHWPNGSLAAGAIERAPGHVIDIVPTLVNLAKASDQNEPNDESQSSLVGLNLLDPGFRELANERALYFEHYGDLAVRSGPWKAVFPAPDGPWELYDMNSDPTELMDISSSHPDRLLDMQQQWFGWAARVGARVPNGAVDDSNQTPKLEIIGNLE